MTTAAPASYADYAADREDPRFTDWLRARSGPAWDAATDHRFVRELHADTLDDDAFRRYLLQDYAFVETLVGVFGHAVGDAPSMPAKSRLIDFLATLTDDENDYFLRSFDALDVPESRYADPELTETTAAFRDLLLRASREGAAASERRQARMADLEVSFFDAAYESIDELAAVDGGERPW